MFYDDGNLRVDPSNVVSVDDALDEMTRMAQEAGEYDGPFENPLVKEVFEEVVIPDDDDIEDYEVVIKDPTEVIEPTRKSGKKRRIRK